MGIPVKEVKRLGGMQNILVCARCGNEVEAEPKCAMMLNMFLADDEEYALHVGEDGKVSLQRRTLEYPEPRLTVEKRERIAEKLEEEWPTSTHGSSLTNR